MSFLLLGLVAALFSWLATQWVRSHWLKSAVWGGFFALLASPIPWVGHGVGVMPALDWLIGLGNVGFEVDRPLQTFAPTVISLVTTFLVVFSISEGVQRRPIRVLVTERGATEAFRTADECVSYLEQIEGSKDGPFAVEVSNKYRESLSFVLGGALTTYVYRPAPGRGNGPSYSRGLRHGSLLSYTLFGKPEVAPPERCVPRETLVPVLTSFFDEGGRSRLVEWEGPG